MLTALGTTKGLKFVDIRHNLTKEQVQDNSVDIKHVPSAAEDENIFTNPLDRSKYKDNCRWIGVVRI